FMLWFISTYYIKHKFLEINTMIIQAIKYNNKGLLMRAIIEHNYWELQTRDCNHFFRCITFIIYYMGTGGIMLFIYMIHHPDSTLPIRIISTVLIILFLSLPLFTSIMSTWISVAAHKPYPLVA